MNARTPFHKRPETGFAVVAVLILVALIASVGLTYMRHTAMKRPSSTSSNRRVEAREAVLTGVEVGRKANAIGEDVTNQTVTFGQMDATVNVTDLADGTVAVDATAIDSAGLGSTLRIESQSMAYAADGPVGHPNDLPRIDPTLANVIKTDGSIPIYTYGPGMVSLSDTTIEGILIIEKTSALFVDDVVVKGAVITRAALEEDPPGDFDPTTVPCLVIDGNFRIEPGDYLPGVSIAMPDGVVRTWYSDTSIQMDGDVIAHTIEFDQSGAAIGTLDGSIAYCDLQLSDNIDRPGYGREPEPLSDSLSGDATWESQAVVTVPMPQTIEELSAITGYWQN